MMGALELLREVVLARPHVPVYCVRIVRYPGETRYPWEVLECRLRVHPTGRIVYRLRQKLYRFRTWDEAWQKARELARARGRYATMFSPAPIESDRGAFNVLWEMRECGVLLPHEVAAFEALEVMRALEVYL